MSVTAAPISSAILSFASSPIKAKLVLTDAQGAAISSTVAAALGARRAVVVTLAGPGAGGPTVATATCTWSKKGFFECDVRTPKTLVGGPANPYVLTARQDLGAGASVVPVVGGGANPLTLYFR
jgi:hypothetical protein